MNSFPMTSAIKNSNTFPFEPAPRLKVDEDREPSLRGLVERCVVYNLMLHLERNGWQLASVVEDKAHLFTEKKPAMELIFDLDDCRVFFRKGDACHCVVLVFGNDGYDCACDWSLSSKDDFGETMEGFDAEAGVRRLLQR